MTWTNARAMRLPSDWGARRTAVKKRAGGQCEAVENGFRCPAPGRDVDHIIPGDNHELENLRLLCVAHHKAKTQRESAAARWRLSERRPAEKHPRWD